MKIAVFGATGGTGKHVVRRALDAGHHVTAVARKPEAITLEHDNLSVVRGDVLEPASVAEAVASSDAVISAIGPANNRKPGTLLSEGIRNIVAAASTAGVKRFVFESGLMMTDGRELSFVNRVGVAMYRRLNHALYADKKIAEDVIRASDLDWVIVRPPALTDGPGTGRYVAGPLARVTPSSMPHADVADALVRALSETGWSRQLVNVGH